MKDVKVGDDVLVFMNYGKPRNAKVVKVARTLATLDLGYGEYKFRLDTGRINDHFGGSWFKTYAEMAYEEERDKLLIRLKELNFEVRLGRRPPSNAKLEAIVKILEAPDATGD